MNTSLLETLTKACARLNFPVRVGKYEPTPLPPVFVVLTPLGDTLVLHSDNTPRMEVEEARVSIYVAGNYLPVRDLLTRALLKEDLTITSRAYVGSEPENGYHHYVIDVAAYRELT